MKKLIYSITYMACLLLPVCAHAEVFYAVRSYCMPEEGRFMLEPFPIGFSGKEMSPQDLAARKAQGIISAPKTQSSGVLTVECQIYSDTYKAVVDYDTRDSSNKYLSNQCNKKDTFAAGVELYRNGQKLIRLPLAGECETPGINKVAIWQKDDGTYKIELCQQTPSWNNGDPTVNQCDAIRRANTAKEVSESEFQKFFRYSYEMVPTSATTFSVIPNK